jgi:hypothetical protein
MTLQIGQTTPATGTKEMKKHLVAVACGLALTVAAAAGLSAWRAAPHTGGGRAAATTAPALSSTGFTIAGPAQGHLYYVVGSQEQADQLEFGLQSAARMGEAQTPPYEVVIVDSPEALAQFRGAMADAEMFAATNGVEGPRIADGR